MENEISILLVEDEALIAQQIKALLQESGYHVTGVYYKYQKALTALDELDFDVLITDINLGNGVNEKSGIQLAEQVKKNKDCPVIFLTAFSDRDTMQKAISLSPAAYLVKPVSAANLFAAVQLAVNNFVTQNRALPGEEEKPDYFFVKQGNQLVKICWKDVYHLEYVKNYVKIASAQHKSAVLVRGFLTQIMETMMPPLYRNDFIKINRAEVIAKKDIVKIDKDFVETTHGKYKLGSEFDRSNL